MYHPAGFAPSYYLHVSGSIRVSLGDTNVWTCPYTSNCARWIACSLSDQMLVAHAYTVQFGWKLPKQMSQGLPERSCTPFYNEKPITRIHVHRARWNCTNSIRVLMCYNSTACVADLLSHKNSMKAAMAAHGMRTETAVTNLHHPIHDFHYLQPDIR